MNTKQNKGITLVALVITIIVLIILAGVSINAIMSDGLITNSKNAKDKWASKSAEEELGIAELDGMLEVETLGTIKAGESAGTENKKYTDSTGKTAIIPAGFTVSNIKYTQTIDSEQIEMDESKISDGLVIYSNKSNDASITITPAEYMAEIKKGTSGYTEAILKQTYNQYVWIPVENPSEEMYGMLESPIDGIEGIKFGKLYFGYYYSNFNNWQPNNDPNGRINWPTEAKYKTSSYVEPGILSRYDTDSQYHKDILGYNDVNAYKAEMVQEFNDMITSVEKYKGFYIGRYELTSTDGTTDTANVVKGKNPLDKINWYNFYNVCTKLEEANIEATDKVRTSMIWGCQWDQAVKVTLIKVPDFLTNASAYGVYSDSEIRTYGVSGRMPSAYNIFDMGGNAWDWTLEAYNGNVSTRTMRGGYSASHSSNHSAAYRYTSSNAAPNYATGLWGCRSQLYIK